MQLSAAGLVSRDALEKTKKRKLRGRVTWNKTIRINELGIIIAKRLCFLKIQTETTKKGKKDELEGRHPCQN